MDEIRFNVVTDALQRSGLRVIYHWIASVSTSLEQFEKRHSQLPATCQLLKDDLLLYMLWLQSRAQECQLAEYVGGGFFSDDQLTETIREFCDGYRLHQYYETHCQKHIAENSRFVAQPGPVRVTDQQGNTLEASLSWLKCSVRGYLYWKPDDQVCCFVFTVPILSRWTATALADMQAIWRLPQHDSLTFGVKFPDEDLRKQWGSPTDHNTVHVVGDIAVPLKEGLASLDIVADSDIDVSPR